MSDFTSSPWVGRNDGPGPEHARWHSTIQDLDELEDAPGVALIGFASDEGVRRNHGRTGASRGPEHIMSALAGLAVHHDTPLYDVGTITVHHTNLEGGHDSLSSAVDALISKGHTVIVLGGGHETAFGSHRGLRRATGGSVGIINIDAHFDLRVADQPTSGTPFRQIADITGKDFNYTVFGISRPNNTRALFSEAEKLGVSYYTDDELASMTPAQAAGLIREVAAGVDTLHLSIDLDALPASVAPGVSAQLVTKRFHHTLAVAVALAVVANITGVLISFHWDASTGASIVLCQAAGFFLMLGLRALQHMGKQAG